MTSQLFKISLLCITFCVVIHPMEKTKLSDAVIEDKAELVQVNNIENAPVMSDIDKCINLEKNDIALFLNCLDQNTELALTQLPEIFKRLPMHIVASYGTPEHIELAVRAFPNHIYSLDYYENSALHYASQWGTPSNISRLIELGCNKEATDMKGATPLHRAAQSGKPENISRLIELGCNKEATDTIGATPLHHAAAKGTPDNISRLIELGCNKEATAANGATPLHFAAKIGSPETISRLIELGCNKEATDINGATPLHLAAKVGSPETISRLIELGCNKEATDINGATPLHSAAESRTPDNISRLIELGCDKEAPDKNGGTPLLSAAECGTPDNISRLIELGCNKDATDTRGQTPLDYARRSFNPNIANQLIALGVKQKVVVAKKTGYTLDELNEIKEMDSLSSTEQLKIVDLSITQLMRSNNIPSLEKLSPIIEIFERRCIRLKKSLEDDVKNFKKDKTKKKELDKDIKKIENLIDTAKKSLVSNRARIKSLQDAERNEEKKQLKKAKELQKKLAKEEAKKLTSSAPTVLEAPANLSIAAARSNDNSPNEVSKKEPNTQTEDISPAALKISSEKQESIDPLMNPIPLAAQNFENSQERPQKPKLKKRLSQLFAQAERHLTSEKKSKKKHEFTLPAERKASKSTTHYSDHSSESQYTPESSQDKTPRNPKLKRRHSQFFSIQESESQLTSSARAPLLRTISLANLSSAPRPASYKRLSRQLSSSDLRKITDIKLSETDITNTLEQLQKDGLIEYRNEDNKISANKIGDHTVALTIHTHTTKNKEWTQNPSIIKDFLEFVRAVNPELYDAIKGS